MISSSFAFLHLSIVVLIAVTLTATANVSQSPAEAAAAAAVRYNTKQHASSALTDHHTGTAKQVTFENDELSNSNSVEEESRSQQHANQAAWFPVVSKRHVKKLARAGSSVISGGDGRLWAIPYRFGKRANVLPYRFGKRAAAMHFRLGKKSATL